MLDSPKLAIPLPKSPWQYCLVAFGLLNAEIYLQSLIDVACCPLLGSQETIHRQLVFDLSNILDDAVFAGLNCLSPRPLHLLGHFLDPTPLVSKNFLDRLLAAHKLEEFLGELGICLQLFP